MRTSRMEEGGAQRESDNLFGLRKGSRPLAGHVMQ